MTTILREVKQIHPLSIGVSGGSGGGGVGGGGAGTSSSSHLQEEIIEEVIKDNEGRIINKNKFIKGKFLGKVRNYF